MSKPVKDIVTAELGRRYRDCDSACVVDLTGLDVAATQAVRAKLREQGARMHVVKNSLACRAFADTALEALCPVLLGPCALVTTAGSLVEVAQTLVETAKEFTELTLKQGILDGEATLYTIEELAKMRSKSELVGEVAMLISSPARALAGCLSSPPAKIAGCLEAMIDKAA